MKKNIGTTAIKYLIAGFVVSLIGDIIFIIYIYNPLPNVILYLVPILSALVTTFSLKKNALQSRLLGIGIITIGFIIMSAILAYLHVTDYFYYQVNPNATELSLGSEFIMGIIYTFNFIGFIIGIIIGSLRTTDCKKSSRCQGDGSKPLKK